jgi:chromate transporter
VHLTPIGLFWLFFKAGWAFGGGLGILAVLEDELVTRRKAMTRADFLAIYGLGRIVPSGTMTGVAVAFGYRFAGIPGTIAALVGMVLPAFTLTVLLTIGYDALRATRVFTLLPVTLVPAAVGLIIVSATRLGQDVFTPSRELALAAAAFVLALFFDANPAVVLVAGGVIGAFLFRAHV